MPTTKLDLKSLGATFYVASVTIPGLPDTPIADNEYNSEVQQVNFLNAQAATNFQGQCSAWLNAATNARTAGQPLPPKPISPASTVVLRQDVAGGSYIMQMPGDVFGVCPDLPPATAPAPGVPSGGIATGDPTANTTDLADIKTTVHSILDMLTKAFNTVPPA
jgi:hypothetical protein